MKFRYDRANGIRIYVVKLFKNKEALEFIDTENLFAIDLIIFNRNEFSEKTVINVSN